MDVQESLVYWKGRKDYLYSAWGQANLIAKDREAIADVRTAVQRYNEQVPDAAMRITVKQLKQSLDRRRDNIERANQHVPAAKTMQGMAEEIRQAY
jgi:hypothetical protein